MPPVDIDVPLLTVTYRYAPLHAVTCRYTGGPLGSPFLSRATSVQKRRTIEVEKPSPAPARVDRFDELDFTSAHEEDLDLGGLQV